MANTPLNPEAMRSVRQMTQRYAEERGVFTPDAEEIAERAIRTYLEALPESESADRARSDAAWLEFIDHQGGA